MNPELYDRLLDAARVRQAIIELRQPGAFGIPFPLPRPQRIR